MAEALTFLAISLLVGFMMLRAYATRTLAQLRDEAGRQLADERHARQEKEREESVLEGLQARVLQLQEDHARFLEDTAELTAEIERVGAELRRVQGQAQGEGEEDPEAAETEGSAPREDDASGSPGEADELESAAPTSAEP